MEKKVTLKFFYTATAAICGVKLHFQYIHSFHDKHILSIKSFVYDVENAFPRFSLKEVNKEYRFTEILHQPLQCHKIHGF